MDTILLITLVLLLVATLAILYLSIKSKPKNENKEVEEQIHDLAMKADMSGKADYRQVFDDKNLELYRQSVK